MVKLADLKVVERRTHSMTVPYVPAGQDATVSYGNRDFRFQNNSGAPILIWSHSANSVLHIGFYGRYEPPRVTWQHQILATTPPPLIYQNDPSLPGGVEKIVLPGAEGAVVKSWLEKGAPDGAVSIEHLGVDRYSPMPLVIRRGVGGKNPARQVKESKGLNRGKGNTQKMDIWQAPRSISQTLLSASKKAGL